MKYTIHFNTIFTPNNPNINGGPLAKYSKNILFNFLHKTNLRNFYNKPGKKQIKN